jgi:hypothetical protein
MLDAALRAHAIQLMTAEEKMTFDRSQIGPDAFDATLTDGAL